MQNYFQLLLNYKLILSLYLVFYKLYIKFIQHLQLIHKLNMSLGEK